MYSASVSILHVITVVLLSLEPPRLSLSRSLHLFFMPSFSNMENLYKSKNPAPTKQPNIRWPSKKKKRGGFETTSEPLNPPKNMTETVGVVWLVQNKETKQRLNVKIMQNSKDFYLSVTLWNKYKREWFCVTGAYVDTSVCVCVCICCLCR